MQLLDFLSVSRNRKLRVDIISLQSTDCHCMDFCDECAMPLDRNTILIAAKFARDREESRKKVDDTILV